MSMTQTAFLKKADIPTNGQIQDIIQKLGYDFRILSELVPFRRKYFSTIK